MRSSRVLALLVIIALILILIYGIKLAYTPKATVLQGQIEAREYNISSKLAGRIEHIMVRRGDQVQIDDLLYSIRSPEADARLLQAKGGTTIAQAQKQEADAGARKQQVMAAHEQYQKAKAAATLAQTTFYRIENLFKGGVIARQKRDEAYTQWRAAEYTEQAALAMYQMTREGSREETKKAAAGKTQMAQGALNEISAILADSQIRATRNGEISEVLLYEGELVPSGFPVVNLIDISDVWAVIQVREDLIGEFTKGKKMMVTIPALNTSTEFEVTYVSVMGDFATWRATESGHGFDMRTFEVELRPLQPISNIRVGMSVLIGL